MIIRTDYGDFDMPAAHRVELYNGPYGFPYGKTKTAKRYLEYVNARMKRLWEEHKI